MIALAPFAARSSRRDPDILKAAVDRRLQALLPDRRRTDELAAALRHSLLGPGKRIRPLLTVLAASDLGTDELAALEAGCALEMVHAASLILDDMPAMDNAAERRGRPATHVRFGEDVAMLAAISLLSLAYETIAKMDRVEGEVRCRLIAILARAVGPDGLAGGQFADLRPASALEAHEAAEANRGKTGALFVAAVQMAAAIRGAGPAETEPLTRCAAEIGQAYQILDDLADEGEAGADGRLEDEGKATILSLIGPDAARLRLRQHVEAALTGLGPTSLVADYVRALFGCQFAAAETA